jgi:division protein CdvB (Snf7/Vps24/ESCRT-III family)
MTNVASNPSTAKPRTAAETRQIVLKEIGAKWGKFSEQDLSALKGKDDLVTQIVAKYSLEKNQVQRDVDALLKGRQI